MTIAIDIRLLGKKRTGDEAVFFHLTKELLKIDGVNQYLLLTDEIASAKIASLYAHLDCIGQTNVEVISLPARNRFTWNLFVLPKYLFQNKIDIFHTQYILPFFSPKRTKIVTHIHDISFCVYPELIGFMDRFFLSLLIPRSLKKASLIITPSQFTKDEIIKYYKISAEKITVIYNGIGDTFLEKTERNIGLREKYKLPSHFIISVGTLQPRKNIPFLINAFALLKKRIPQMKLVIVGNKNAHHTDTHIDETIVLQKLENDVFFPGFIEQKDLPGVIQLADVFVFPSLYEGFGIPLLEAMSQNVPIGASDIPSLREIGGDAVEYFDKTSLASCEETLYNLCTHQIVRKRLQLAGSERIELFSWKKSALFLFETYKKLFSLHEVKF